MISAIVPAYNEPAVGVVVEKLLSYDFIEKVIVVDDGSKERVRIIHERVEVIRNERNLGKEHSIKRGLERVETPYVLLQDADLEYPVENVEFLYSYLPADMVVAKRFVPIDKITLSGVIANRLITSLLKSPDVFSGQRIIRKELLEKVVGEGGFELETKLTLRARREGWSVVFVDTFYYPRGYKEGKKIRAWHMIPILWEVVKDGFFRPSDSKAQIQDSVKGDTSYLSIFKQSQDS